MEDEQAMGKVILNKTDKDTKKPMKGVEFALCDSKGKVLETLVTDSAGHAESKNYPIATFKNLFLLNDSESETVGITIRDKKTMSYLQEWMGKKQKLGDGRITEEEYLEWKLHWPEDKRKTEYKTV